MLSGGGAGWAMGYLFALSGSGPGWAIGLLACIEWRWAWLGEELLACIEWRWAWLGDRARGCSWCDIQNTQSVTKRLCSKRNAVYLQAVSGWHKHSCFSGSDERLGPHLWQPVPPMMASVRLLGCNQQRV